MESAEIEEQDGNLTSKNKKEYRVRIDEEELCTTIAICVLPTNEIILIDNVHNRLKKLDITYKCIANCQLAAPPLDVCNVGDGKVVVSLEACMQFVAVENLKLETNVRHKHKCQHLACHRNILYYTDEGTVCKCNIDCSDEHVLYKHEEDNVTICKLVVSNDGEKIYLATATKGIVTINSQGICLSVLKTDEMKNCRDICIVGDNNVLVCDVISDAVFLVGNDGKQVLDTVVRADHGLRRPRSMCFDKTDCTLIIGSLGSDFISVFRICV